MPITITGAIHANGPTIALLIVPHGAPAPAGGGGAMNGIIDTAAQQTALTPAVINTIAAQQSGHSQVHTAGGGAHAAALYSVDMYTCANPPQLMASDVIVNNTAPVGTQFLLGQNVLQLGTLTHDGINHTWEFHIP
jgi:hypothetical protein